MPHGSRIRPKQIAEAFEDRSLLRTGVHGVPLKGWSVEVWTPQFGEAGVLEGKVHEGVYGVQLSLDEVKGWTAILTKKTFQLTSPALRNRTRYGGVGQKFLASTKIIHPNSPTSIAPNYINKGLFYSSILKLQNKPLFI